MNIPIKNKIVAEGDRNPAEYAVLGALERGPAHGYDLYHYLSANLGAIWTLGLSQVYALLVPVGAGRIDHPPASRPGKTSGPKNLYPDPHGSEDV